MKRTWRDYFSVSSHERRFSAFRNRKSISNSVVSLPNVSKKDVKGLLFRKQPLHTSPNRSKRGDEGAALLSSLGNLSSPPRRLERVESQNECSIPERFDEFTSAWLSDTIDVLLAKVNNVAPIDSRSKLERASLLRFVSWLNWYGSIQELFNLYQHKKSTESLKLRVSQIILYKARLSFQPCFQ